MSLNLPDVWLRFLDCAGEAQQRHCFTTAHLDVAGVRLRLRFSSQEVSDCFLPALAHLRVDDDAPPSPQLTFTVCDSATTGIHPPPPPFANEDYHWYGRRAVRIDEEYALMHAPDSDVYLLYCRAAAHAICWTRNAAQLSIYERAAPLQTLFHWALPDEWQVVHAAALGRAEGGVLLVGNSGAGKSTTALAALHSDEVRYLCDDKCLVRLTPRPQAFALFSAAKVKDDMLGHLPRLAPQVAARDDLAKGGKSLVYLHPHFAGGMIRSFPLRAIVVPRIAHLPAARLTPARAADAFRVLGPSTAIWLPGAAAESYRFLGQLSRSLPCYFLDLAEDPHANLPALADLLDTLSGE